MYVVNYSENESLWLVANDALIIAARKVDSQFTFKRFKPGGPWPKSGAYLKLLLSRKLVCLASRLLLSKP